MLGSVDSNTGSPDLGWDTDEFPMDVKKTTLVMKVKTCFFFLCIQKVKNVNIHFQSSNYNPKCIFESGFI